MGYLVVTGHVMPSDMRVHLEVHSPSKVNVLVVPIQIPKSHGCLLSLYSVM